MWLFFEGKLSSSNSLSTVDSLAVAANARRHQAAVVSIDFDLRIRRFMMCLAEILSLSCEIRTRSAVGRRDRMCRLLCSRLHGDLEAVSRPTCSAGGGGGGRCPPSIHPRQWLPQRGSCAAAVAASAQLILHLNVVSRRISFVSLFSDDEDLAVVSGVGRAPRIRILDSNHHLGDRPMHDLTAAASFRSVGRSLAAVRHGQERSSKR